MMLLVCYDANALAKIEQEMQIIKVKFKHWTSRQECVFIQVCMLGMQVCRLRIVICIMVICMPFVILMLWLHT